MNYFKTLILIICSLCLSIPVAAQPFEDSVVNIVVTSQKHDYESPWQKGEIQRASITGCVIEGNRILTTAYSLTDHVLLEVLKKGESRKYEAAVILKDYHSGLAILKVEDARFFDGLKPVQFSPAGKVTGRTAKVYKWDAMSSFKEYTADLTKSAIRFYEPSCGVLMHQFSTSMNDGGSGEPVFIDGKLAGIAAGLSNETKTLFVIAIDAVVRLLKDADSGGFQGIPFFWIDSVELQSDSNLRTFFGLEEGAGGALVTDVPAGSSGGDALKKNDIILSIDGHDLDDNGMYESPYGKLYYFGLIQLNHFVGDTITMKILRERKRLDIQFTLKPVPEHYSAMRLISNDRDPLYYIFGGMVFQELSIGYLESAGQEWKQKGDKRLLYYYDNVKSISSESGAGGIVVLSRVLPNTINKGYQYYKDQVLKKANGVAVKDLPHLREIISGSSERFIVLEFVGETMIVLDRQSAMAGEQDLLKTYNINSSTNIKGR
jgi:S1-C subfamily serine protease